jgi:hypothetical protein
MIIYSKILGYEYFNGHPNMLPRLESVERTPRPPLFELWLFGHSLQKVGMTALCMRRVFGEGRLTLFDLISDLS